MRAAFAAAYVLFMMNFILLNKLKDLNYKQNIELDVNIIKLNKRFFATLALAFLHICIYAYTISLRFM